MSVCPAGHGSWRAQHTTCERPSFAELQEGTWLPSWPDQIGFTPLTGPHSHLGQQEAEGRGKATAFTIAQVSHTQAQRTDSGADPSESVTYFLVQSLLGTFGHQPPDNLKSFVLIEGEATVSNDTNKSPRTASHVRRLPTTPKKLLHQLMYQYFLY